MAAAPRLLALVLLAGCAAGSGPVAAPLALLLPDSTMALDAATGASLDQDALLRRLAGADVVLLGELHDNPVHHRARGALIAALAARRPAVVFEQLPESRAPLPPPVAGEEPEAWLDRHGFDRQAWRWPLHRPVVAAALRHGSAIWGAGVSREALRPVVRQGETGAPEHLRALLERAPLDSAARAAIDRELVEGHCGQLPASLIPGLRAAQAVRDAAMANALLQAGAGVPAWLIAGNGHVRRDVGVPRLLAPAAPGRRLLVLGLLERAADGAPPDAAARAPYDVVLVTPRTPRADPCAGLRAPAPPRTR